MKNKTKLRVAYIGGNRCKEEKRKKKNSKGIITPQIRIVVIPRGEGRIGHVGLGVNILVFNLGGRGIIIFFIIL